MTSPSTSFVVQKVVDRRTAHRARLATTVTVTVGSKLVDAISSDVSAGGMRLLAQRPAPLGDPVSLVFFLNGDIVCARGIVRWCARTPRGLYMFGIAFVALEDDGPSLVSTFCHGSIS